MHQNSAFENLEAVASAFCLDGEPKERSEEHTSELQSQR